MPDRSPLPPDLSAALDAEAPETRADLEQVWTLLGTLESDAPSESDRAWERLAAQMKAVAPGAVSSPTRRASDRGAIAPTRTTRRRRALAYALPLVIIAVVGAWWMQPVHLTAGAGEVLSVSLPDGSTATLNSGATLAHRRGFARLPFLAAETRAVRLEGEAFFDVESDERPFIVETFNAQVTVLGTAFNVRAHPNEAETRVAVSEGRVRVTGPDDFATELTIGQGISVGAAATSPPASSPEPVEVEQATAWRTGGFAVRDLPLRAVFDELERRYGVEITAPTRLEADGDVTLYLSAPSSAEEILNDLCTARGLTYRATSRGFAVSRAAR
ncbi:MAG: hypothetical protein HKN04_05240 [Rhodothermaceae bacterium]|nr:hypothetical protein [Rhodothermaceae bacterium]